MASKKKVASLELDNRNGTNVMGPAKTDEVARRAYEIYLERGCSPGLDVEDWLQAERELKEA